MSGIGVLVGAGLRGRRRTGLVATFAVLVLAAVAIAAGLEVSRQGGTLLDAAAADAVLRLVQAGILMERTGYQKNRIFVAPGVLQILNRPFGTSPL